MLPRLLRVEFGPDAGGGFAGVTGAANCVVDPAAVGQECWIVRGVPGIGRAVAVIGDELYQGVTPFGRFLSSGIACVMLSVTQGRAAVAVENIHAFLVTLDDGVFVAQGVGEDGDAAEARLLGQDEV